MVTMAESGAVRQRRYLSHKAGDHSLCKRCAVVRGDVRGDVPSTGDSPKPVADAEAELRVLAGQLAEDYRGQRGNALLARELRMTLQALLPAAGGSSVDDDLEALFKGLPA
jgi:hypothetical protein